MSFYTSTTRAASRAETRPRSRDCPPADFDPAAMPILSRHWFGVALFPPNGNVAAEVVADLSFRRRVQRLHGLGPRVTAELLAEIGAERGIMTIVDRKLDTYAEIEPEALEAAGGDKFWPAPIHGVQS